jgi:hypothetical protein
MELFTFFIAFIAGFIIGEGFVLFKLRNVLKTLASVQGIDVEKELEKAKEEQEIIIYNIQRLEIEQVNDTLYLYDRLNHIFICQATSIEELAKLCKSYNNIVSATVIYQDKVFIFDDGTVQEYTQ